MITLDSFSNHGDNPITVTIEGQTPDKLVMSGLSIDYNAPEIHSPIVDWKGSITFFGKPTTYDAFGDISFKSHKVSITYADKIWAGFLVPEVYTVPNTGFDEYFTLNVVSSLDTLKEQFWSAENGLNSITDLLNVIKAGTNINSIETSLAFTESLSNIKVHHSNFFNDDGEPETLYSILVWILTAFSLRGYVDDNNRLVIKSFELLNDPANGYPTQHYGINETYSVTKRYEKATVKCSNYQFPDVDTDFSFSGGIKVADQPKLEVRRGKHYLWSKVGSYFVYERQLYQYVEGQKDWRFHKYGPSGEVSEFDQSQYYNAATGEITAAGAFPYAWRRYSKDNPDLSVEFEQATWFKLYHSTNQLSAAQRLRLISYYKENVMFSENTYLFVTGSYAWIEYDGVPDSWITDWNTGYDGVGNMNAGAVLVDPAIPHIGLMIPGVLTIMIKFNDKYWSGSGRQWTANETWNVLRATHDASEHLTFVDIPSMPPPVDPISGTKVPFVESVSGFWCKMPNEIGTLEIQIGVQQFAYFAHLLFRNFAIRQFRSIQNASEVDLSRERKDTVYTNTGQNMNELESVTFYLCSKNPSNGRSCLYLNDPQHKVDELTYQHGGGSEKPEWHYIRVVTKMMSKAHIFKDIFAIDDMQFGYADRYFNGGSFNLIEGTIEGQWVVTNTTIAGEL